MTTSDVDLVRLYTAIPREQGEFLDEGQIQDVIDGNDEDLFAAASEIWGMKAANAAQLYSAQVDGSTLSLQQIFDHCKDMRDYYKNQSGAEIVSVQMTTLVTDTASEFS